MRREKRLTKREKKAQNPEAANAHEAKHIHCVACGRHIDPDEFGSSPPRAVFIRCDHGSQFAACTACQDRAKQLIVEHDRSGRPVAAASAWH